MKIRNFYIIIFLTIFGTPLFSQTAAPKINFEEKEFDFGSVKSGDEAIHYFVFINEGSIPLVISNVRTSCGCAVPEWPKTPIGGEERDSLRVEYNTRIRGAFDKTIMVYSNASDGMHELRIKGNVIKKR
jgi:hypothetical protein